MSDLKRKWQKCLNEVEEVAKGIEKHTKGKVIKKALMFKAKHNKLIEQEEIALFNINNLVCPRFSTIGTPSHYVKRVPLYNMKVLYDNLYKAVTAEEYKKLKKELYRKQGENEKLLLYCDGIVEDKGLKKAIVKIQCMVKPRDLGIQGKDNNNFFVLEDLFTIVSYIKRQIELIDDITITIPDVLSEEIEPTYKPHVNIQPKRSNPIKYKKVALAHKAGVRYKKIQEFRPSTVKPLPQGAQFFDIGKNTVQVHKHSQGLLIQGISEPIFEEFNTITFSRDDYLVEQEIERVRIYHAHNKKKGKK